MPDLTDAPRAEPGETVLVVDDELSVRMLVAEVFEDLGYTAIEASDGPSGCGCCSRTRASTVDHRRRPNGRQVAVRPRDPARPEESCSSLATRRTR